MARYVISDHLEHRGAAASGRRTHTDGGSRNADVMEGTVMLGIAGRARTSSFGPSSASTTSARSTAFTSNGKSNQVTGTLAALTYF